MQSLKQIEGKEEGAIVEIVQPISLERAKTAFAKFEEFKKDLLGENDSVKIGDKVYLKKSAWRKWALVCSVSDEIISEKRVPETAKDAEGNFTWYFTVRAFHAQSGRQSIGVASASFKEKSKWAHEEHDIRALAHTRAKSRGIADLIGGGELSAEEIEPEENPGEKVSAAKKVGAKVAEQEKSEDAFSAEYYLDRLQWYTAENGKNRPWKAGDKWGWCSATIGFGNPGVLEYAKPVVDAAQDDPRGFVEVGSEEVSYDKDKGRLFRVKKGASIPTL